MAGYDDISLTSHTACFFQRFTRPKYNQDQLEDADASTEYDTSGGDATPAPTRRPRGRPPGSKNKAKPPVVLARDSPNSLRSHVLEFSTGSEILGSLNEYARRQGRGISVLSASGAVSDVSLRHSGNSSLLNLRGTFEIMSLTGTVLPPPAPPGSGGLALFMTGPQGMVVGGCVEGRLVAAGPVVLVAASFSNAVYERLPLTEESQEGEWEGQQVGAASQASSVTGGGWIGEGSSIGQSSFPSGGDLSGWVGNGVKAHFSF